MQQQFELSRLVVNAYSVEIQPQRREEVHR